MFMSRSPSGTVPGAFDPPAGMATMPVQLGGGFFDQILNAVGAFADDVPAWSLWPNMRDAYLAKFWKTEPIFAGALYSMEAKVATLGFDFKGKRPTVKAYYQELAGTCDNGEGLASVFQRTLHCLYTCDNGAFWYLHGAGRPESKLRGRVVDIRFLDSAQCWRTYDPDYPVIYFNPFTGGFHRLHKTRVVMFSSMTQPNELGRKVGFCWASRLLQAAQIIRDIRLYMREKVGGQPTRGMLLMQGINIKQIQKALEGDQEDLEAAGLFRYRGVEVLASLNKEIKAELVNLASLPDGFNQKDEVQNYVNIVALTGGTDAREFWPATVSGANKGEAEVTDRKGKGKGFGDGLRLLRAAMNWRVMGKQSGVQFDFNFVDFDEQQQKAEIGKIKADTYKVAVDMGSIIPEEARAMMIADETLDISVLTNLASSANYDEASPVVDENQPENSTAATIYEVPESAVNTAKEEAQQAQLELAANNADNTDETDQASENAAKPKRGAKRADLDVITAFEPIVDGDISWALRHLEQIL